MILVSSSLLPMPFIMHAVLAWLVHLWEIDVRVSTRLQSGLALADLHSIVLIVKAITSGQIMMNDAYQEKARTWKLGEHSCSIGVMYQVHRWDRHCPTGLAARRKRAAEFAMKCMCCDGWWPCFCCNPCDDGLTSESITSSRRSVAVAASRTGRRGDWCRWGFRLLRNCD